MSVSVIEAACRHWGLGDAPVTLVAARENSVYRVDRPSGPAALRLHRQGYRSAGEIQSELQWMAMLANDGIPVPDPIPTIDGKTSCTIDGIVVDMLSWIDGTPLSKVPITEAMYFELGCVLARMHDLADAWSAPTGFNRPTWNLLGEQPSWDRFWENPKLGFEERIIFEKFREDALHKLERMANADIGLIHADLVPDNVLWHDGQLQIIDFDDGGFGYRLFDLATITHRSRCRYESDELARATVAGYIENRFIDLDQLPLFEALRACTYVGWNISRMEEAGGDERNERFITEALQAVNAYKDAV